jgi:N-acetylmuramoyl-L-alanine amidase
MMIPQQEALLRTNKFQHKCAQAIMEGIVDFVKEGK